MISLTSNLIAASLLGYIGPGGGIALLGPLVGVLLAVLGAVGMIAFWPLRALWKRMRSGKNATQQTAAK